MTDDKWRARLEQWFADSPYTRGTIADTVEPLLAIVREAREESRREGWRRAVEAVCKFCADGRYTFTKYTLEDLAKKGPPNE